MPAGYRSRRVSGVELHHFCGHATSDHIRFGISARPAGASSPDPRSCGDLLISRILISGLRTDQSPEARLLLLRVFGHDRRTERLLDELTLRWRPFGTVDLIAGRDLALRNIDPDEFYGSLTGKLTREFVRDGADLDERLARRDDRKDPDGRFESTSSSAIATPGSPRRSAYPKPAALVYASDIPAFAAAHAFPWSTDEGFELSVSGGGRVTLSVPPQHQQRLQCPASLCSARRRLCSDSE
jgi:hypothetical protein